MVDIAVGLVEVAVAVGVVPIPDVVLRELRVEVARGHRPGPGIGRGVHERPHGRADVASAQVRAVARLVERHQPPVGDFAVDRVPVRRLLLVEVAHRVLPRRVVEEQVGVVRRAEVGRPDRDVVGRPVRLRDLVVQRTGRAAGHGIDGVPELAEDREDRVLALAGELDVLALGDLADLGALRDLALGDLLKRDLLERLLLLAQWVREIVRPGEARGIGSARRRAGDRKADPGGQDENERSGQEREEPLPHVSPLVDGDPLHGVRRRAARPYRRHPEKRNREP